MAMIFLGQVNGCFDKLALLLKNISVDNNIIQSGNFGLNCTADILGNTLQEINRILFEKNIQLFIIRGNRDNPSYFDGRIAMGLSNMRFVDDGTILEADGNKIFCLGGAISKDRSSRRENFDYWREEKTPFKSVLDSPPKNIDFVVTFQPPPYIFNARFEFEQYDNSVQNDACLCRQLEEERDSMRKLMRVIEKSNKIKLWVSASEGYYAEREVNNITFLSLADMAIVEVTEKDNKIRVESAARGFPRP